jgi:hypothetical protein
MSLTALVVGPKVSASSTAIEAIETTKRSTQTKTPPAKISQIGSEGCCCLG